MDTAKSIFSGIEWLFIIASVLCLFIPNAPRQTPMFLGMFYIVAMPVWSMSSEYKVLPIFTGILSGFGLFLLISTLCFQAGQWPFAKEMVTATPLMVLPILAAVGLIVLIAKEKAGFVWHHSKFRWLFTTIAFIYVCQLPLLAFWKSIFIEVAQGK